MEPPDMVEVPISDWRLLGPPPGHCKVCAVDHPPEMPHNPQSLYWQAQRKIDGLPPATWIDALAHCPPEMRRQWIEQLKTHGIEITE